MMNQQQIESDDLQSYYEENKDIVVEKVSKNEQPFYNLIVGKDDFVDIVNIHKTIRNKVRGKAGNLG